ncbi:MAG: flagellar basal body rod protein FlgC [Blastocatellia bacterium]
MSLFNVFRISSQGMTAQRERLEAAAANLANANTTRTAEGGPYRRRDIAFEPAAADRAGSDFGGSLFDEQPEGVRASTYLADAEDSVRQYQPGHPDANADGYVALPDVNSLEETVNILSAARAFEANATAFNTAKELARASLRLGENG